MEFYYSLRGEHSALPGALFFLLNKGFHLKAILTRQDGNNWLPLTEVNEITSPIILCCFVVLFCCFFLPDTTTLAENTFAEQGANTATRGFS